MATKRQTVRQTAAKAATPKKPRAKAPAALPRVRQAHGGALLAGGVKGNRGGGPLPSVLRDAARAELGPRIRILARMADGVTTLMLREQCPKCGYVPKGDTETPDEVMDRQVKPADQRGALDTLVKLGMGAQLSVDEAHANLAQTLELIAADVGAEAFARLAPKLRAVWQ